MKTYTVSLLLVLASGCTPNINTHERNRISAEIEHREPNYKVSALGGTLLGYDYGEFYGGLFFKNEENTVYEIISENVVGIYSSKNEILVFTGINHLLTNEGAIYKIEKNSNALPQAKKIKDLSGKPYEFFFSKEKRVTFMVKAECYAINFSAPNIVTMCAH